jgi:hypothetical protein
MSEKAMDYSGRAKKMRFDLGGATNWLSKNVFYIFLLVLQLGILYLLINPINLYNQLDTVGVINSVGKVAVAPPGLPTAVARVGDGTTLAKADDLRKGNQIDAVVYKDAQDGDYVLGYQGKTIIYRKGENKIVYNDKSAQVLLQESQQNLVALVLKKSQDAGIVAKDYNTAPAVSVVTDADAVKKINEFYSVVQKDDLVAQFSKPDVVVVYRPSTDQIVKSGSFALVIK